MTKIYNTKYALTQGIIEQEAQITADGRMAKVGAVTYLHIEGKEWHRTYESARNRAEQMRITRMKSLERSLKKLLAMRFDPKP